MSNIHINSQTPLVPLTQVTEEDLEKITVGVDIRDLSRLGLIGEYKMIESTSTCPRLYYRFNYIFNEWEIYAIAQDLIDYNLLKNGDTDGRVTKLEGRVDRIEDKVFPTDDPTYDPTEDPTHSPEWWRSKIGRDRNHIGGDNLEILIDKGMIIFAGTIKWYDENSEIKVPGNYIGIQITPNPYIYNEYKSQVKVEYNGEVYGSNIFYWGQLTLIIKVNCPGQEVPICIHWSDTLVERFIAAVTLESTLEKKFKNN